ncbi:MAG: hypothetical protein AAGA17_00500 [Actinomycetota bacterium]
MATVSVPIRTLEEGDLLPKVCAVTGQRAERQLKISVTRTPFWVWFLVLLPILFIPAWVFATERVVGRIPVITSVYRRMTALSVSRTLMLVAAAVIGVADLIGLFPGPGFLVSVGLVVLWIGLGGRRAKYAVRSRIDPGGNSVTLEGVAPTFADAVEQLQPFLR